MSEETQLWTTISDLLLVHVVSLCRQRPGKRPEHIGTGILVEVSGQPFLVSARHVLNDANSLFFYIGTNVVRKLSGQLILGKPSTEAIDRIDIAVLHLQGDALPPYLDADKICLDGATGVRLGALPRAGKHYLVSGFPQTRTKANPHSMQLVSAAYTLIAKSSEADTYKRLGVAEETHLVLPLDRKETIGTDGDLRAFPDPHGMSGAPVWWLPDETNQLELPMLVGVVIEYHEKDGAIVATDISEAMRQVGIALRRAPK